MTPPFVPRPYATPDDLTRLMQAASAWGSPSQFCGIIHPGYIAHLLTIELSDQDLTQHLHLLTDDGGALLGMVLINRPKMASFEVMVHPDQRGSDLESALITFGEARTREILQAAGLDNTTVSLEVMDCDTVRRDMLIKQGYQRHDPFLLYSTRSLLDPIPEIILPAGFTIRHVAGVHEADLLTEVHNGAFNAHWQPGEYADVMRSFAYNAERELVVVAPDGRFAAFLLYYLDTVSKIGLFEPIGCHPDFRRKGLTRALIVEGMRRMIAQRMMTAMLKHEFATGNPASAALYASTGFKQKYIIEDFRKILTP